MSENAEQLYREREQRVLDAISLKEPDRVPIFPLEGFFPARYQGITVGEAMYESEKMLEAWIATATELQPDLVGNPYTVRYLGKLLEALDFKQLRWARHGLGEDAGYQFVEGEYMQEDEYDAFLFDPSDYLVRTYWPRVFGALEAFRNLPPINEIVSYYLGIFHFAALGAPEVASALQALTRAAAEAGDLLAGARKYAEEMRLRGFPLMYGALTQVPYDTLGDFFRGTRGLMLDLYRRPEKVEQAVDKLLPIMIHIGVAGARRTGVPRVFIPLHKGPDGFLSREHFARFYWPGFRALMFALIEEGLTPCPFVEGSYDSRLDFLADVPPGKVCYHFESTDLFAAKKVLGDKACIRGNVPLSLLATGTPEEVKEYCKKLIDVVGAGGGFVMDASTVLTDARPANVKAMFQVTKEYGVYS